VQRLEDDGNISDTEDKPRQMEEDLHKQACAEITFENERRNSRIEHAMAEVRELRAGLKPMPASPSQILKRKREDLKRNKARSVRCSEAQRIRGAPVKPQMSKEFCKLAYLEDPIKRISRCRRCGAIPHLSGELCLWKTTATADVEEDA
jgi:hypothetical protein